MVQIVQGHREAWPIKIIDNILEIENTKRDLELVERGLDPCLEIELEKNEISPMKVAYFEHLKELELQASGEFKDIGNDKLANDFLQNSQMWESEFFKLMFNERIDVLMEEVKDVDAKDLGRKLEIWDEINTLSELTAAELIARGGSPFSDERVWRRIKNAKNKSKDKIRVLRKRINLQNRKGKKNKPYINHRRWDYNYHY